MASVNVDGPGYLAPPGMPNRQLPQSPRVTAIHHPLPIAAAAAMPAGRSWDGPFTTIARADERASQVAQMNVGPVLRFWHPYAGNGGASSSSLSFSAILTLSLAAFSWISFNF
jgi:hypothetical protein